MLLDELDARPTPGFEAARRWRPWHELPGVIALVSSLALWVVLAMGVRHLARKSRTAAIAGISGASAGGARDLAKNATMRLPGGRFAATVRVERGTVLVTQEGDLEDYILEAGDELVLPPGGLAIAWAFTDAALSVRRAASAGPRARAHALSNLREMGGAVVESDDRGASGGGLT